MRGGYLENEEKTKRGECQSNSKSNTSLQAYSGFGIDFPLEEIDSTHGEQGKWWGGGLWCGFVDRLGSI